MKRSSGMAAAVPVACGPALSLAVRAVLAPRDPAIPVSVALDFEASADSGNSALSCGTNVKPEHKPGHSKPVYPKKKDGDKQCWEWTGGGTRNCFLVDAAGWKNFALGWAAGVSDAGPVPLDPAIYMTRDQYRRNGVGSYGASRPGGLPVIVGVSPVLGGTPVTGAGIAG